MAVELARNGAKVACVARNADKLAETVKLITDAGGTADGSLGTSVDHIQERLRQVVSPDGTLVLVDLGSAVLSVEMAIETLGAGQVQISDAPLVEGAYLAAIEASAEGTTLEQVAEAALQARELIKVH